MARRRVTTIQKGLDEDVRMMAALAAVGVISIVLFSVFIISPPATIGPNEGELAHTTAVDGMTFASPINSIEIGLLVKMDNSS